MELDRRKFEVFGSCGWCTGPVAGVLDGGRTRDLSEAASSVRSSAVTVATSGDKGDGRSAGGRSPSIPGVFIHESSYVDEPVEIGSGTKIWHFSHVLARSRIGKNCVIGQNVVIGPDVTIGNNCKFQNNVSIYPGITIEDGVFCGPSCVFTNVINPRAEIERKTEFRPTRIRRGATIGANATIVCGHDLGQYCFIAAGAVVTREVPDFALMIGTPARRAGWMSRAGARLGADLVCPLDGSRYRETGPDKLELVAEGPGNG